MSGVRLPRGLSSLLSAHSLEVLDERSLPRISFTGILFFSNIKCKIRTSGGVLFFFFLFLCACICACVCACVRKRDLQGSGLGGRPSVEPHLIWNPSNSHLFT